MTSDTTLTIGDSPGHGSAEDTSVSYCNSLHKLSFGSTQLSSCVCLACVRQAHVRTAMHATWLCCGCSCVCSHQTEKRQVGAQQDLALTCASCETCPFFGFVESVAEHMKKPLFECTVLMAQSIGVECACDFTVRALVCVLRVGVWCCGVCRVLSAVCVESACLYVFRVRVWWCEVCMLSLNTSPVGTRTNTARPHPPTKP